MGNEIAQEAFVNSGMPEGLGIQRLKGLLAGEGFSA